MEKEVLKRQRFVVTEGDRTQSQSLAHSLGQGSLPSWGVGSIGPGAVEKG